MIKLKTLLAGVALATIALSSCEEDITDIGNSLTNESDKLNITTTTFNLETRTITADSVLSLSNECYFGKVKDPETGANVTSEFTTQFHLLETMYISPDDSIMSRYNGIGGADSCDIILYPESPFMTKDSLLAMKMQVMELQRPTEEGERYYSNYDPISRGMVRADGVNRGKMFTFRSLLDTDSLKATKSYLNNIRISLNGSYTDQQGVTYCPDGNGSGYGTYLMQQYFQHPENFRNSYAFTHNVCPGFFFKVSDGYGFHAKIANIGMRIYYRVMVNDTVRNAVLTLAGTKEVLQTTHVTNDQAAIDSLARINTCTYLKSPAGLFTEVTIPIDDIRNQHQQDSLLAAKVVFQRINNGSNDERALGIPANILMLPKEKMHSFFEKNELPDSKTSYYAAFASATNTYSFNNISNLLTLMWNEKQEGLKQNANWLVEHPDWNKVVLVPVKLSVNASTYAVTSCEHDMSLNSTRLVGGSNNPNDPVQINIVYAKFKE